MTALAQVVQPRSPRQIEAFFSARPQSVSICSFLPFRHSLAVHIQLLYTFDLHTLSQHTSVDVQQSSFVLDRPDKRLLSSALSLLPLSFFPLYCALFDPAASSPWKDARSRKPSAGVPHLYLAGSEQIYKLPFGTTSRFLGMRTNLSKMGCSMQSRSRLLPHFNFFL
jgi:hypothetical protein